MGEQSEITTGQMNTGTLAGYRKQHPIGISFRQFFSAIGTSSQKMLSGLIPPKQARAISFFATALLMAVITLACCREINLYCFRSVARSENAALMFKNTTSNNHAPLRKADKLMLSQTHSMI
ncbi:MAG TPA: hypothetical protein V6C76_15080 [Drouetiella sp.]